MRNDPSLKCGATALHLQNGTEKRRVMGGEEEQTESRINHSLGHRVSSAVNGAGRNCTLRKHMFDCVHSQQLLAIDASSGQGKGPVVGTGQKMSI